MNIKQGEKVLIEGTITGVIAALNSGEKYRVKIGDQEIWIKPEDINSIKEDE